MKILVKQSLKNRIPGTLSYTVIPAGLILHEADPAKFPECVKSALKASRMDLIEVIENVVPLSKDNLSAVATTAIVPKTLKIPGNHLTDGDKQHLIDKAKVTEDSKAGAVKDIIRGEKKIARAEEKRKRNILIKRSKKEDPITQE